MIATCPFPPAPPNHFRPAFFRDGHDRLTRTYYPAPTKGAGTYSTTDYEEYIRDEGSNLLGRRTRAGEWIYHSYDNLSRMATKNLPTPEPDVDYAWDNLGRLLSAGRTGHVASFTYDALSRKLSESGPRGTSTSEYDLAGRRTKLTYPGGTPVIDYDYLVTGEMATIEEGSNSLALFAYDDMGRRIRLYRGNGTEAHYGFDGVSRLSALGEYLAGTAHDLTLGFTYNPASQIKTNTRNNDLYGWSPSTGSTNYTANGLNQYTDVNAVDPTYDNRGNLTNDGARGYTYSSENLLVSTSTGATLAYDPLMRLYAYDPGQTTLYLYDGLDRIAEYSSGGSLLRRYVHGPGMDEPLVWYEGNDLLTRRFHHADERGSIVAISDNTGAGIAINNYDEYGIPSTGNLGAFQYTGQTWLGEIGLYYYKARMYHPTLGRFMQTDPIGYADGLNLYAYVKADPVNFVDPTGLENDGPITVIGMAIMRGGLAHFGGLRSGSSPHREGDSFCAAPPTSRGEAAAATASDTEAYWKSRAARGDPLARTALGIVRSSTTMGRIANVRLRDAISSRSPNMSTQEITQEVQEISVEIMIRHMNLVDSTGQADPGAVAAYHFQVLAAHGLPPKTYGGAQVTGTQGEAVFWAPIYMDCR